MTTQVKPKLNIDRFRGDNVFVLIAAVVKTLERSKQVEEAREFHKRVRSDCEDYDAVFDLAEEYVDTN